MIDLKNHHKALEKAKRNYYEANDSIKKAERDLEDFMRTSKDTLASVEEKVLKRKEKLEKLQLKKQGCQIAYVSQIVA